MGIDKMGGYFVTMARSKIPASSVVLCRITKQDAQFIVCMDVVQRLDVLDADEWQTSRKI